VFVIDIQDHHQQPIARLIELVITAYQENQNVNLEVFVHKAEALSEEYKIENFKHIQQRVLEELDDYDYGHIPVNFHLTSIHDHSLQDAFSKVVHKLIDSLPYIEDLLNVFCGNSQATKAFLFDVKSRLYVATDASPVDSATHSLCSDFLLTLNSLGPLYKSAQASTFEERQKIFPSQLVQPLSESIQPSPNTSPRSPSSDKGKLPDSDRVTDPPKALFYPSASTSLSPGSTETTVTCHLITPQLALLALIPTQTFEGRRGLVEYNVVFFREGVQEIWQVEREARTRG
jgi:Ras-related GTP-binding protein C/D